MDTVTLTPNLTILVVRGWQVYVSCDGDAVTVIDTGAPGSGAELHDATGATVFAGAGDAAVIRDGTAMPPPVFEDWEIPIHQRVSAGLPESAPPVPALRELHVGDVLDFGGGAQILAVPGHTDGSIAIYLPSHGVLFTGDTIATCTASSTIASG